MTDLTGRNWEVNHQLIDCAIEYKRLYNLYLDADFEDRLDDARFYKSKAEHFKSLVDRGIEFEPQFQGEKMSQYRYYKYTYYYYDAKLKKYCIEEQKK